MNKLDILVTKLIEDHTGGEKFFDCLDFHVAKDFEIMESFFKKVNNSSPLEAKFIGSGKFGQTISNIAPTWLKESLITVNGSLRKGHKITDLSYAKDQIKGYNFIFLDDSFYSGSTRDVVKKEIERLGGNLISTIVIYDGSLIKEENVSSMYRYYN